MTQHYTDSHKNETVQHRVIQTHTKQYSTTQHCTGTQKKPVWYCTQRTSNIPNNNTSHIGKRPMGHVTHLNKVPINERKSEQAHIPHAPTLLENAVYNEWLFQALVTGNQTKKGIKGSN